MAVIGWKLQRKEKASRAGARRADYPPRRGENRSRRGGDWSREEDEAPRRRIPAQARGVQAEVSINPGKCMRFAFCEQEAPEVFKLQGDRIGYKPTVPADQVDAAEMAAKVCPARAIKIKIPGTKPRLAQPEVDDDARRPVRR